MILKALLFAGKELASSVLSDAGKEIGTAIGKRIGRRIMPKYDTPLEPEGDETTTTGEEKKETE